MSPILPSSTATALWVLAAAALHPAADAAIYRCSDAGMPPRFSQFPCGDGEALSLEPLQTVRIPPIDAEERRLLDTLERQHAAERDRRARDRQRAAREAAARRDERRERCAAARAARAALDRHRRKGYRLAEAQALDRREAELLAEERRNC